MNRRKRQNFLTKRKQNTRNVKKRILVIYNGKETEGNYIKALKTRYSATGVIIKPRFENKDALKLVESMKRLKEREENNFDEFWCIFDVENVTPEQFIKFINISKKEKIQLAYSKISFELWILLHNQYVENSMTVNQLSQKIKNWLGNYKKTSIDWIYEILPLTNIAITNAQKLAKKYQYQNHLNNDPITFMHLLINSIR